MKKLIALCLTALVFSGCGLFADAVFDELTSDSEGSKGRKESIKGYAERGFAIVPWSEQSASFCNLKISSEEGMGVYTNECSSDSVDSLSGRFAVKTEHFEGHIGMVTIYARDFLDVVRNNVTYDMELSAIIDVPVKDTVRVNYLTSLAVAPTIRYLEKGLNLSEAMKKANEDVVRNYKLPSDLTDFGNYSIWGSGEGDAMLLAMSILIQEYYREHANSTAMESLEIDSTGNLVSEAMVRHLAVIARDFIEEDKLDSLRKVIEDKSPTGKAADFEKYISDYYTKLGDMPFCDDSKEGKKMFSLPNYDRLMACSDGAWHVATWKDFSKDDVFNPEVSYGTLVDSRDGQEYKIVSLGTYTWMAENLRYVDSSSTKNLKGQVLCYDNDEKNCEVFGPLYTWTAAMDIPPVYLDSTYRRDDEEVFTQGLCPEGWHLPRKSEYDVQHIDGEFFSYFGFAGSNGNGLSLVPTGYGDYLEESSSDEHYFFRGINGETAFWTAETGPYNYPQVMYLSYSPKTSYYSMSSVNGASTRSVFPVRCVQDFEW